MHHLFQFIHPSVQRELCKPLQLLFLKLHTETFCLPTRGPDTERELCEGRLKAEGNSHSFSAKNSPSKACFLVGWRADNSSEVGFLIISITLNKTDYSESYSPLWERKQSSPTDPNPKERLFYCVFTIKIIAYDFPLVILRKNKHSCKPWLLRILTAVIVVQLFMPLE